MSCDTGERPKWPRSDTGDTAFGDRSADGAAVACGDPRCLAESPGRPPGNALAARLEPTVLAADFVDSNRRPLQPHYAQDKRWITRTSWFRADYCRDRQELMRLNLGIERGYVLEKVLNSAWLPPSDGSRVVAANGVLSISVDHHAFRDGAKPGDLSLRFPPISSRSSANQFWMRTNVRCPSEPPWDTMTKRPSSLARGWRTKASLARPFESPVY